MRWLQVITATLGCAVACLASAQPVRVASWNLGWHVSAAEVPNWIQKCDQSFRKSSSDGIWKVVPSGTQNASVGWTITEYRAQLEGVDLSFMPPCAVFQTPARSPVAVTLSSYVKRSHQLASYIRNTVNPDVIAFQEVSGTAAVAEALGPFAKDFEICSFDGRNKVQRLAFAWRRSVAELAEACKTIDSIALPKATPSDQVRPGYQVGLKIRGKLIRFLNLHLKSGCVSPLDGGRLDTVDADSKSEACILLQQQVRPLEAAIEQLSDGADRFVVFGDFNRNIWHEQNQVVGAKPIRSDNSSDLKLPLRDGIRTQSLLLEVNDGEPVRSQLVLLHMKCGVAGIDALCTASKNRKLTQDESRLIGKETGLGCRNGIGLDHILVSKQLEIAVKDVTKLPLGKAGLTLEPTPDKSDPLLALSDHCPFVAALNLQ